MNDQDIEGVVMCDDECAHNQNARLRSIYIDELSCMQSSCDITRRRLLHVVEMYAERNARREKLQ